VAEEDGDEEDDEDEEHGELAAVDVFGDRQCEVWAGEVENVSVGSRPGGEGRRTYKL
jgi:hypothetical protein